MHSAISQAIRSAIRQSIEEKKMQAGLWTPVTLFSASEPGVWYDPSDMSTMFQDAAGTTPVTAVEQPVGRILDKSGRGNHATQTTATSRPVLSARYNLLTKTEQFEAWTKFANGVSVTPNATTDPLGGSTADKLIGTAAASSKEMFSAVAAVTSGASYTASVYAKAAEYSWVYIVCNVNASLNGTFFNLATGEIGNTVGAGSTPSITSAGDGWYRVSSTRSATTTSGYLEIFPATANGTAAPSYTGDGTSGIYIWGASLVPANQASLSYQRVNTATDYDADPSKFKPYLRFDGVDDWLVTPSINFTSTDKMTVFAGVRKLSDAAAGMLLEHTSGANGTRFFHITNAGAGGNDYNFLLHDGVRFPANAATTIVAPISSVLSCGFDFSKPTISTQIVPRINASTPALTQSGVVANAGNFVNAPLFIGRRNGTAFPFNGHIYSLIVRGAQSTAQQIANTETWVNQRTGAY